ncbi:MAG TPA: ATP-binding protein, partial [Chitinophagaceae bacterium]|nr:ATP-binding protein [Chitinophagaceae bacterium]
MNREMQIITIDVQNELDIMLSHRRGMQFSKYCGIALSEQTRFATAISELCRNVVEFAKTGSIAFSIINEGDQNALAATISDRGPGIEDLDSILDRKAEGFRGRGLGIVFARKLSDGFLIDTSSRGTQVQIKKHIPPGKAVINRLVIQGWIKHLAKEPSVSPYEELKARNIHLLELTDELSAKARVVDQQMEEIKLLNKQLASSNQQMKEFTYAISHDLKTPLSSLNIAAEYLDMHPRGKESPIYRQILGRSVKRLDKT